MSFHFAYCTCYLMSHIGDKWFYIVHCMLKQKFHTSNSVAVSLNKSIFTIFVLCQSTSILWMNQPSIHVLLCRWVKMYNRLADLKMFLLPVHDILNQKSWSNWIQCIPITDRYLKHFCHFGHQNNVSFYYQKWKINELQYSFCYCTTTEYADFSHQKLEPPQDQSSLAYHSQALLHPHHSFI